MEIGHSSSDKGERNIWLATLATQMDWRLEIGNSNDDNIIYDCQHGNKMDWRLEIGRKIGCKLFGGVSSFIYVYAFVHVSCIYNIM